MPPTGPHGPPGAKSSPRPRRVRSRSAHGRSDDARDVRAEILAATERLLAQERLEDVTVADVIEAAGVSRATF